MSVIRGLCERRDRFRISLCSCGQWALTRPRGEEAPTGPRKAQPDDRLRAVSGHLSASILRDASLCSAPQDEAERMCVSRFCSAALLSGALLNRDPGATRTGPRFCGASPSRVEDARKRAYGAAPRPGNAGESSLTSWGLRLFCYPHRACRISNRRGRRCMTTTTPPLRTFPAA